MSPLENERSEFARALAQIPDNQPLADQLEQSFDLLSHFIQFDSGHWAIGTLVDGKGLLHHTQLYKQPNSLLEAHAKTAHENPLPYQSAQNPNQTFTLDINNLHETQQSALKQAMAEYDVGQIATICSPSGLPSVMQILTLWRCLSGAPYTDDDVRLCNSLAPIFFAHHRYARVVAIQKLIVRELKIGNMLLVCNEEGVISDIDDGWVAELKRIWPDWQGPVLPTLLRDFVATPDKRNLAADGIKILKSLSGYGIVLSATRLAHIELTQREHEIARLFADGLSNKAIATQLNIAPATVRNHLSSVYQKLNVNDRIGLSHRLK